MAPPVRPSAVALALLALLAWIGASCGDDPSDDPSTAGWTVPAGAAAGDLVAATAMAGPSGTPGATAWDVRYVLQGVRGRAAVAGALLVSPPGPVPAGGWPLVVWAHPTRGTADTCAPSLEGADGIADIDLLLAEGWAVLAPDYEGLGSPGPHPYLVGTSGAHSLIDAAVAATSVPGAGLDPAGPVALVGFSQGGHAAAFAAESAHELAPMLDLRGVVLAAPVSDVTAFTERAEARADQVGVAVTVIGAYGTTYDDVDPADVLTPSAMADLGVLEEECIGEVVAHFDTPPSEVLTSPVADVPALAARLAANRAGERPLPVPALVVQGRQDDIVDPDDTDSLVERWCSAGADVEAVDRPGASHGVPLADLSIPWLRARFAGEAVPSGCSRRSQPTGP